MYLDMIIIMNLVKGIRCFPFLYDVFLTFTHLICDSYSAKVPIIEGQEG